MIHIEVVLLGEEKVPMSLEYEFHEQGQAGDFLFFCTFSFVQLLCTFQRGIYIRIL